MLTELLTEAKAWLRKQSLNFEFLMCDRLNSRVILLPTNNNMWSMFIPGFVIGWATFPGVVVHEWAHKTVCQQRGISVHEVAYFTFSGGGYVQHAAVTEFEDQLAVSIAPLLVNTAISAALWVVLASVGTGGAAGLPVDSSYIHLATGWLALSIGWHAIPSTGDARNIYATAKVEWRYSDLAALSLPLVVLLYVANALSLFWFDAIYALSIAAAVSVALGGLGFDQTVLGGLL